MPKKSTKKPRVTRTYGPIHFEDLDPHRFEDLVRELIYDYKDWQSIEATGRGGNDDGFDIRAYEKQKVDQSQREEDGEQNELHPMLGNQWMIQGKREKVIGPKRVEEIIADVDAENPPYGYILAASANFSKDSYDTFREELRKKGVMEFHLWGRAELEDMLHFPKNDHILFTFFGISLVSRKRSRTTEIRRVVIQKNKLYKLLGEGRGEFHQSVLLRDSNDVNYPYEDEYGDFDTFPRWREYKAIKNHTDGVIFAIRKHYAYIDKEKKEYDYTEVVNLIYRESDSQDKKQKQQEDRRKVESFWEYLPRHSQATFIRNGLVQYDEILVIDEKGDNAYEFPHLFVDFNGRNYPFAGSYEYLDVQEDQISLKDYKRIKKFPDSFLEPSIGTIHEDKNITLSNQHFSMLKNDNEEFFALYDLDGRYSFLQSTDLLKIENQDQGSSSNYYLRITHVERVNLGKYLEKYPNLEWAIERQIEGGLDLEKTLNICEFKKTYSFVVEQEKSKRDKKKS